tara:strand:+ start:1105 stop:1434 length:330 start_codon:yes stop_codon:yes gene_type:complete
MNIELLKQLKKDTDAAIKAENDYIRKSERCRLLGMDASEKQRSKATSAMHEAAFDCRRCEDNLHATLVDLEMTPIGSRGRYEPRQRPQGNGGINAQMMYAPRKPQALQK